MTLTTTMGNRRARARRANPTRLDLRLDIAVLAVAAAVCALLFFHGGLEALVGSAVGAAIGARSGSHVSGALAGLWSGALCAGFFHGALAALIAPLF
jgi:hypothetical protein